MEPGLSTNRSERNRYFYDGWVHLLPDIDGVRLMTNDVCELLQKVPGIIQTQLRN